MDNHPPSEAASAKQVLIKDRRSEFWVRELRMRKFSGQTGYLTHILDLGDLITMHTDDYCS